MLDSDLDLSVPGHLIQRALSIALTAHRGQTDKLGKPYIFHPLAVMMSLQLAGESEEVCAAGVLHDAMEDNPKITYAYLESRGIPQPVLTALTILTHDPADSYDEYVRMLRADPIARTVKLADIRHNMSFDRLSALPSEQAARLAKKYTSALAILNAPSI